jgi:hypothetical protein
MAREHLPTLGDEIGGRLLFILSSGIARTTELMADTLQMDIDVVEYLLERLAAKGKVSRVRHHLWLETPAA